MEAPKTLNIDHTLKCSVCDNYLNVAPVLTSEDGKINKCGRCNLKGPQLTNRNSLYESIGSKLSFPCINEKCNKRLAWQEVERHEKTCLHRKIPCPFWVCRDKELAINMLKDTSHFQADHPGILCEKKVTVSLADIKRHPSFIKLLIVDSLPYFLIVHGVSTGERIWVGVFNFDVVQKNYQIKLFADETMRKCIIYKEPVRLYDQNKQCIYCLQNLCSIESHKYSKCYQDVQKEKFKYYTKIDVLCTKNVLLSDDLSFEVSIAPFDIAPLLNGNA